MADQAPLLPTGKPRSRRPNARPSEIILGAIDERLTMIQDSPHAARLSELMDELRRSLSRDSGDERE